MQTNKAVNRSARKENLSWYKKLERTVMCCLLWENNFYEDGESVNDRIDEYCKHINAEEFDKIIHKTKFEGKLRHIPLYLIIKGIKCGLISKKTIADVITRVDDMTELLSLYWNEENNKHSIPHVIQNGIELALPKFDEYQFGKYKANKKAVKLKDVIKICRPKPFTDDQSVLFKKILNDELKTPYTWEVELSKGRNKHEVWTELLNNDALGALALLRNIRNMREADVDSGLIRSAIRKTNASKLLPFQIISSYRINPDYGDVLEEKFLESTKSLPKLTGKTVVLIDVSGSMDYKLSEKGELKRLDVASSLASIIREQSDSVAVYTFNNRLSDKIPTNYRGFSLIDYIIRNSGGSTSVIDCTNNAINLNTDLNRIIVITDEQTNSDWYGHSLKGLPNGKYGYMINVGVYQNGIAHNANWQHISGWSDNIVNYIYQNENVEK